jgi:hypothetical protein
MLSRLGRAGGPPSRSVHAAAIARGCDPLQSPISAGPIHGCKLGQTPCV